MTVRPRHIIMRSLNALRIVKITVAHSDGIRIEEIHAFLAKRGLKIERSYSNFDQLLSAPPPHEGRLSSSTVFPSVNTLRFCFFCLDGPLTTNLRRSLKERPWARFFNSDFSRVPNLRFSVAFQRVSLYFWFAFRAGPDGMEPRHDILKSAKTSRVKWATVMSEKWAVKITNNLGQRWRP